MDRDPEIIYSDHCTVFVRDDVVVQLQIYRLETIEGWSLEVVNEAGTSIVWDYLFATDEEAYAEFRRTVDEDGMAAFAEEEESKTVH